MTFHVVGYGQSLVRWSPASLWYYFLSNVTPFISSASHFGLSSLIGYFFCFYSGFGHPGQPFCSVGNFVTFLIFLISILFYIVVCVLPSYLYRIAAAWLLHMRASPGWELTVPAVWSCHPIQTQFMWLEFICSSSDTGYRTIGIVWLGPVSLVLSSHCFLMA